jgi:DNA-binding MarR family transcriptional regulator
MAAAPRRTDDLAGAQPPHLEVTPRNITGLVDGLEGAGLVRRVPHPSDRRAALVELTVAGRRLTDTLRREQRAFAGELVAGLSADDVDAFVATADHLLTELRRYPPTASDAAS